MPFVSLLLDHCQIGDELLALRRSLVLRGVPLTDAFHATTDKQAVRDAVFGLISNHDMRIDATVFEKAKTYPYLQNEARFYELAWYQHMKHVLPRITRREDALLVISASIGTMKKQAALGQAMEEVMDRYADCAIQRSAYWPAASDPCLQIADYCSWAIQRKWERRDERSYILIKDKISTEFEAFRWGRTRYY